MKNDTLTLGSLFDGSGGFPLAGLLSGITPIWASEVEPFPIRVTTKQFPFMKHYGDISQMDGGEIDPVNIISFGSPCQAMSIAGKREGLAGPRSNLFFEAIRIIKEMRCATNGKYPRYIVWENVPGAFSSNGGEDFRCVCESICQIKDEQVSVPRPEKWSPAGEIVGDGLSLAWRQLDAQFWGVPQRRKRIYLVADLDGWSAGKILFESEGLSGYSPQSYRAWKETAGSASAGIGETGCYGIDGYNSAMGDVASTLGVNCGMSTGRNGMLVLNDQGGNRMDITEELTCTLRAEAHHPPVVLEDAVPIDNHPTDSRIKLSEDGQVQTLTSRMETGGNNVPLLLKIRSSCEGDSKEPFTQENKSCNNDHTLFGPFSLDCRNLTVNEDKSGTLQAKNNGGHSLSFTNPVAYGICSKDSNAMKSSNPNSGFYEAKTTRTLDANGGNPSCHQGGMAIVALEGNGSRPSHHGDGYRESDTMYTLNGTEVHAIAFTQNQRDEVRDLHDKTGCINGAFGTKQQTFIAEEQHPQTTYTSSKGSFFTKAEKELANTLIATDYKDPPLINDGKDPDYIVRRLTPTECARLQGFPDWWCSDLGTENPTEEEVQFWKDVWETHRRVISHAKKPKTEKQVKAWLADPHTDSAEYRMWGNGICLYNAYFVLSGIVWANKLSV